MNRFPSHSLGKAVILIPRKLPIIPLICHLDIDNNCSHCDHCTHCLRERNTNIPSSTRVLCWWCSARCPWSITVPVISVGLTSDRFCWARLKRLGAWSGRMLCASWSDTRSIAMPVIAMGLAADGLCWARLQRLGAWSGMIRCTRWSDPRPIAMPVVAMGFATNRLSWARLGWSSHPIRAFSVRSGCSSSCWGRRGWALTVPDGYVNTWLFSN